MIYIRSLYAVWFCGDCSEIIKAVRLKSAFENEYYSDCDAYMTAAQIEKHTLACRKLKKAQK